MDKESQKKRSPNFTEQDYLLLAEIMGQGHPDFKDLKLTFHKVDKHRFNSRISSSTKRKSWELVAEKFNASASFAREASIIQKKWDNLVSKHRNMYGDYQRNMTLTGISSSTKRKSWELVAEKFNASASFAREASIIQKKWDNLVSKHRNMYGDYQRNMTLTDSRSVNAVPVWTQ